MPTTFSFEHVFRAPSPAALIDAYFDAEHNAAQDRIAHLERVTVEEHATSDARMVVWRVTSLAPVPVIGRPFVAGGRLQFLETCAWRRGDDHVDTSIVPQVLGGRVQISGAYRLTSLGEDRIRRIFDGTIAVQLPLVAGKLERAIREMFAEQVPILADVTQAWLDRSRVAR